MIVLNNNVFRERVNLLEPVWNAKVPGRRTYIKNSLKCPILSHDANVTNSDTSCFGFGQGVERLGIPKRVAVLLGKKLASVFFTIRKSRPGHGKSTSSDEGG
jgi:hypothetical protein